MNGDVLGGMKQFVMTIGLSSAVTIERECLLEFSVVDGVFDDCHDTSSPG